MTRPSHPRILLCFARLVVGERGFKVRLLASNLDRLRYRIDVVVCFHKPKMPRQTHEQRVASLGVNVDTTPYNLSFDDTVAYPGRR